MHLRIACDKKSRRGRPCGFVLTMQNNGKIQLAWSMMIHNKARLVWSIAGVAFAVLLMFIEMGFLNGVFDSETLIINKFNADILIINKLKDNCYASEPFPKDRITQAKQISAVEAVYPLYMEWLPVKITENRKVHLAAIFAYNTQDPVLLITEVMQQSEALKRPWTMLMDHTCRKACYGEIAPGMKTEIKGKGLHIIGTFPLLPNYSIDGHVIMDDTNLMALWPDEGERLRRLNRPDFGLIRLKPGADITSAITMLRKTLPEDVIVITKQGMIERVEAKARKTQPIVEVFSMGMVIGFFIGVIICCQILFTSIEDHQSEFASLKAIGYNNRYLAKIVMQEGLLLSLLAFFPGLCASFFVYALLQNITGIIMSFTVARISAVFLLTLVMSMLSALIAVNKVMKLDPAELF